MAFTHSRNRLVLNGLKHCFLGPTDVELMRSLLVGFLPGWLCGQLFDHLQRHDSISWFSSARGQSSFLFLDLLLRRTPEFTGFCPITFVFVDYQLSFTREFLQLARHFCKVLGELINLLQLSTL